jgi:3'-5' exoribonuclease 1
MIFIIFDLEATCWKDTFVPHRQEVIEVGAYSVNSFGEFLDTFQKFVKPVKSPRTFKLLQEFNWYRSERY